MKNFSLVVVIVVVSVGAGFALKIANAAPPDVASGGVTTGCDSAQLDTANPDPNCKDSDEASLDADPTDLPPVPDSFNRDEDLEMRTSLGQFTYGMNFDKYVPLYVEECSFSQYDRRPFGAGGSGGHAALYIKGVEIDGSGKYPYPRLALTDILKNAKSIDDIRAAAIDPNWGTGASVDKMFRNVNWVAIPGKDLFLRGKPTYKAQADGTKLPIADCAQVASPPQHTLWNTLFNRHPKTDAATQQPLECQYGPASPKGQAPNALDRTLDEATPYFSQIEVLPSEVDLLTSELKAQGQNPSDKNTMLRALAYDAIGTDFAITFARQANCVRVPMGRYGIKKMIDYLNMRNDNAYAAYKSGGAATHPDKITFPDNGNTWDGINDNCTHMVHNAFAATGIRNPMWSFDGLRLAGIPRLLLDVATLPVMIFQIATPANEFITLARMTIAANFSHGKYVYDGTKDMNPERIYKDSDKRKLFLDTDPSDPTSLPALASWLPVQPGAMVEPLYQIPDADNEIFADRSTTMTILDISTIPGFVPVAGDWIADQIRKTPLAPRQKQLEQILNEKPYDSFAEINPYTHPVPHIQYFSDVYADLEKKYCSGSEFYSSKTGKKNADFKKFLDQYCGFLTDRTTQMAKALPEIAAAIANRNTTPPTAPQPVNTKGGIRSIVR